MPHFLNFDFYVSVLVHCPYFLTFSSLHPLAFKMLFLCLLVPTLVSLFSVFSCLSCTSLLFKFSFQDHFSGLSLSFNSFLSVVLHVAFKLSFCVCFYPVHCLYFFMVSGISLVPLLFKLFVYVFVYLVHCPYFL